MKKRKNKTAAFSGISVEIRLAVDFTGRVAETGGALQPVLGWTPAEITGRAAMEFIAADDRRQAIKRAAEILAARQPVAFEFRVRHKDGSFRWLCLCATTDRRHRLVVLTAIDITRQKRAENERDHLYDIASDILIVSDADGPFSRPNPTCQRVLGWTPEEMTSRPWTYFVHPDDIARSKNTTAALYSGNTVINFENRYRHKDGTYRWLNWRAKFDREDHRIYASAMDITARKQIEQERERFFEIASDVLLIGNYDGYYIKASPACERILGWTQQEMTTHHRDFFVHAEDKAAAMGRVNLLRSGADILHFESRVLHRDGSYRWISWRAKGDCERQLIYYAGVDITGQKKFESTLRRQAEDLAKAKELAERSSYAKTEFLANMSHELRTPMNAVIGLTQLLGLSRPLTPRQEEFIQVLKVSADSLLALINDLLDVAKIESGSIVLEHVAFNVPRLVQDVISMMTPRAREKGLDVVASNQCTCIADRPFRGDPARIRQVLINLCGNAVKFTERGQIRLTVACVPTQRPDIEDLIISVHDTGIGIAADKLDAIFDKFVQADSTINRKYGGTGLGLAITKKLAEIMGGVIVVESELGRGSTFTLRVPLQRDAKALTDAVTMAPKPGAPHDQSPDRKPCRILIVEDNRPNVLVATTMLESYGYQCIVVEQ